MHKPLTYFLVLLCATIFIACHSPSDDAELSILLTNPDSSDRKDITIEIPINKEQIEKLNAQNVPLVAIVENRIIPVQWVKSEEEGTGKIYFNIDFPAKEQINIKIEPATSSDSLSLDNRTHAEIWHRTGGEFVDNKYVGGSEFEPASSLRVPDECTDHSFYIKYEGPGWESDKV